MEETVVEKRKSPIFWFLLTSVMWVVLICICSVVTTMSLSSNERTNTILKQELARIISGEEGVEVEPTAKEIELQNKVNNLQDELDRIKLEQQIRDEVKSELGTPSPTPQATLTATPTVEVTP